MNVYLHCRANAVRTLAGLGLLGAFFGWHAPIAAQETGADKGVQVLTRGPIHEAFAQTVTFNPQSGILVPNAPPDPIEELPPDQRPEGDHVDWIPGYWAWDEDRSDFMWVSGIWRALPPGRQWVPGNWSAAGNEFQWTPGYWADANLTENEYLPEPPATVEAGPNIDAPSANSIWVPGSWVWNQNRYAWRPGYWATAQQNWMWVPAQYLWSPRGYVFVDGYYDYTVARRGVLFAPVYFNPSVYSQRGFTYSPAMAINLAVFANQLFLRPDYNHYYFGDYYGSNYASAGYHPWFSYNSGGYGYDPFYAQQLWQNRQNPGWAKTVQTDFQNREDHESARPPRTLADQQALLKSSDTSSAKNLVVAASLSQLAKSKENSLRLQPVTKEEQQTFAQQGQAIHQFSEARQQLESKSGEKSAKDSEREKMKLPLSPIVAKSIDQLGKDHTPPKTHEAPPLDPKVDQKAQQAITKGDSPKGRPNVAAPAKPTEPTQVTKDQPKAIPKGDPKPDRPKVEPKPEEPKSAPKPILKEERPKVEPKPEVPKPEPRPLPKAEPKAERPKVEPKPEVPKVGPKPVPNVPPKPEAPKSEPKINPNDKPKN